MVKRTIIAIVLFCFLVSLATFEVIAVNNIITELEDKTKQLQIEVKQNEDDVTKVSARVLELKQFWDGNEHALFLMFNHKDLSTITDSLSRLYSYTSNNNFDDAIAEVNLLKEYSEKNVHIMGFNIQNIL